MTALGSALSFEQDIAYVAERLRETYDDEGVEIVLANLRRVRREVTDLRRQVTAALDVHDQHVQRTPPPVMYRCECVGCAMARALGWGPPANGEEAAMSGERHDEPYKDRREVRRPEPPRSCPHGKPLCNRHATPIAHCKACLDDRHPPLGRLLLDALESSASGDHASPGGAS